MNVQVVMTSHDRPDLLRRSLDGVLPQLGGRRLLIWDDFSSDSETLAILGALEDHPGVSVVRMPENVGAAKSLNMAMGTAFAMGADAVVTMDNDVLLGPGDWISRMASFAEAHPEVGVAAPDKMGCYLRLRRGGYDEVEWAVSLCYLIPSRAYWEVVRRDGFWYDASLGSSIDPDLCYRVRMLGYRVGLVPGVKVEDLGEGRSTVSAKLGEANFRSNAKWNRRFLGRFLYKSPLMLRWEEYPHNVLFRRLVNAQQGTLEIQQTYKELSGHGAERVTELACTGNRAKPEALRELLDADLWLSRDLGPDDVDPDLLEGRRKFDLSKDAAPFSLRQP